WLQPRDSVARPPPPPALLRTLPVASPHHLLKCALELLHLPIRSHRDAHPALYGIKPAAHRYAFGQHLRAHLRHIAAQLEQDEVALRTNVPSSARIQPAPALSP